MRKTATRENDFYPLATHQLSFVYDDNSVQTHCSTVKLHFKCSIGDTSTTIHTNNDVCNIYANLQWIEVFTLGYPTDGENCYNDTHTFVFTHKGHKTVLTILPEIWRQWMSGSLNTPIIVEVDLSVPLNRRKPVKCQTQNLIKAWVKTNVHVPELKGKIQNMLFITRFQIQRLSTLKKYFICTITFTVHSRNKTIYLKHSTNSPFYYARMHSYVAQVCGEQLRTG